MYTVAHLFLLKKEKAAFRRLTEWLVSEQVPEEIELAKVLTSVITHALIEVEHTESSEEQIAKLEGYRVEEFSRVVYNLISGATPPKVVLEVVRALVEEDS